MTRKEAKSIKIGDKLKVIRSGYIFEVFNISCPSWDDSTRIIFYDKNQDCWTHISCMKVAD